MYAGIIRLPPKKGVCTLVRMERGYELKLEGGTSPVPLTENQGQILRILNETSDGLIGTELAEKLGKTHAGVLYLLKPLIKNGIVERIPLKGGGVLYDLKFEITQEQASTELEAIKKSIEEKVGKPLEELSIEELSQEVKDLPQGRRRAFVSWVIDGGWKRR